MNMFAANQINEFQGSLSLHDILTTLTLLNPPVAGGHQSEHDRSRPLH